MTPTATTPTVALTIAGTDSAGGAGVHADLRTFSAFGLHGTSAIAALTAQSTRGIDAVHLVPPSFVAAQIESVLSDLDVRATKTGFLGTVAVVEAVGAMAALGRLGHLVVDPVLVRSDGSRMFDASLDEAYRRHLLPHATVATPNRIEAGLLTGLPVDTTGDMERAAVRLAQLGTGLVVVKGGDADDEITESVDVVATPDGNTERLVLPMVATGNDHGSGCTFAAAAAACLARGDAPLDAARNAKTFVHRALTGAAGWRIGAGHGPLDHFGWGDGDPR